MFVKLTENSNKNAPLYLKIEEIESIAKNSVKNTLVCLKSGHTWIVNESPSLVMEKIIRAHKAELAEIRSINTSYDNDSFEGYDEYVEDENNPPSCDTCPWNSKCPF